MATPTGGLDTFLGGFKFNFLPVLGNTAKIFIVFFIILVFVGVGYYISRRNAKKNNKTMKTLKWFEEVNGRPIESHIDFAEEIIIPGTNLRVFYVKKKDMYLPRFTKGMSQTTFYLMISKNREIINFTLKSLEKSMKEVGLDYDHTDMRWATENTREFIKRNYRDKSVKWWKEYKEVIATVIMILVMTFSMVIIVYMMTHFIDKVGILLDKADQILSRAPVFTGAQGASGVKPV